MGSTLASHCDALHSQLMEWGDRQRPVQVMEVCGTHTMSIARSGLRTMIPPGLRLVSGPGCPVCVTDQSYMDQAIWLARRQEVVIATYGDMIRVPGRDGSLAEARAAGAAVEVVYSAQQAVELAKRTPQKTVVFLAVGFETTTPATALSVLEARDAGLTNYCVLTAHKLILPAMNALLAGKDVQIDGFLCPGHVSVILGYEAYGQIAQQYGTPCVVAGFDASQILLGLGEILRQLKAGEPRACTVYSTVCAGGNAAAQKLMAEVLKPCDASWRAVGVIPESGLSLRSEFDAFNAAKRFVLPDLPSYELPGCRCGDVICGRCRPEECKLFAKRCTPRDPVGPCMVSSEGACAAAFKYERRR